MTLSVTQGADRSHDLLGLVEDWQIRFLLWVAECKLKQTEGEEMAKWESFELLTAESLFCQTLAEQILCPAGKHFNILLMSWSSWQINSHA